MRFRLQIRCYRAYLQLMPPEHRRRHGSDQLQTFVDLLESGESAWRLWFNTVPDLFHVYRNHYPDWRSMMTPSARLALIPLSMMSLIAGLAVVGLFGLGVDTRIGVLMLGAGLIVQGGFTLVRVFGGFGRRAKLTRALFVGGETVALVAGVAALSGAIVAQTIAQDPEYGPLAILGVVTAHAIVGLLSEFAEVGPTPAQG